MLEALKLSARHVFCKKRHSLLVIWRDSTYANWHLALVHNKSCLCQEPCSLTGTFWCFQRRYLGFKFPYSQLLTQKIIKKKKKKKSCLYLVHNLLIIVRCLVGSTHPCLFSFKSFCNWYMYRGCPENIYLLLSCLCHP